MYEAEWLTPRERQAWLALVSIMFKMPGSLERQLVEDEDLSLAEYMVLAVLSEAPDHGLRMSDLAAATSTGQSRLSRIVTRLERNGLVRRLSGSADKRVVVAQLTDDGLARIKDAAPGHVSHVRRMVFDRLSPEQVEQLSAIGRTLLAPLEPTTP